MPTTGACAPGLGLQPRLPPLRPGCSVLEQMQSEIQAGKFAYQPPWAAQQEHGSGSRAGHTGHSGASSLGVAFLTPGVLDERRNHSATLTLVRKHNRLQDGHLQ